MSEQVVKGREARLKIWNRVFSDLDQAHKEQQRAYPLDPELQRIKELTDPKKAAII